MYGDHVHSNDGTHLDGGIAEDGAWQDRWLRLVQGTPALYEVPRGKVGRRFLTTLIFEFQGVRERRWNSERVITYIMVTLQRGTGVRRSADIRRRIDRRMDLWVEQCFDTLVSDTLVESTAPPQPRRAKAKDQADRAFNDAVQSGRLRQAVRRLTARAGGGVLGPDDLCTKARRPVVEVLREKHPKIRDPQITGGPHEAFEPYPQVATPVPVDITTDHIERVAAKLSGAAGLSGVDAVALNDWLLRYGPESDSLREEMAAWAEWLGNESPPWAAYRALMACRLVALDKEPGTRPVGIGEIFRRLLAKAIVLTAGSHATTACGNRNLCAGLPAGIEGAVHAVRQAWAATRGTPVPEPTEGLPSDRDNLATGMPQTSSDSRPSPPAQAQGGGTTYGRGNATPTGDEPQASQPGAGEADVDAAITSIVRDLPAMGLGSTSSDPPPSTQPPAVLLVDARNGFNELSRKAMLWTVRHRWSRGARFSFNCYRHFSRLLLRRPGGQAEIILSEEGVTQGDPLSMLLYGIALVPLAEHLLQEVPGLPQPFYADDSAMVGDPPDIAKAMDVLLEAGPAYGYYPEPSKSLLIGGPPEGSDAARPLEGHDFQRVDGHRYLGGFVGDDATQAEWVEGKVDGWVYGVRQLTRVARQYPQSAYAGLRSSLQAEWMYLQRTTPHLRDAFERLESVIATEFIPALLGGTVGEALDLRSQLALPIKMGGLAIPDPRDTSERSYDASRKGTSLLSDSILDCSALNVNAHIRTMAETRLSSRQATFQRHQAVFTDLKTRASTKDARRLARAEHTGAWLGVAPNRRNGTELSGEEFRDGLRLRLGLPLLDLPPHCDGCGSPFTVTHAMSCKKGGLIGDRHRELCAEWAHLCSKAWNPAAVSDEPEIRTGRLSAQEDSRTAGAPPTTALRGDVAVRGFWRRGTTTIFDGRITDVDCPTQRNIDPAKVLRRHENEKKGKYHEACMAERKHFTPLVFSTDSMRAPEADAASRRLAGQLSKKWSRPYGQVCQFVRARLALSLIRSASRCLRGERNRQVAPPAWAFDSGPGLTLFQ